MPRKSTTSRGGTGARRGSRQRDEEGRFQSAGRESGSRGLSGYEDEDEGYSSRFSRGRMDEDEESGRTGRSGMRGRYDEDYGRSASSGRGREWQEDLDDRSDMSRRGTQQRSSGRDLFNDEDEDYGSSRRSSRGRFEDEEESGGRSMSGRSGRSSGRSGGGQGRGWFGNPEGHAEAGRHSHDYD